MSEETTELEIKRESYLNPNRITLFRILLLPLPCALLFLEGMGAKILSLGLGSLLGFTDYIDGVLARKQKKITPLGTLLDPVADKIFVTVVYLTLLHLNYFPYEPVMLLLFREVLIAFLRSWFPEELKVVNIARVKTFLQMALAGLAILFSLLQPEYLKLTHFILWILVFFSYFSALPYFYRIKRALKSLSISFLFWTKAFLSLLFNFSLLIFYPYSGDLFWIIQISLSFYFFRKGLAKASPFYAQGESFLLLLLLLSFFLEVFLFKKLFYSLWLTLFFSLYRDGFKSLKVMGEILRVR